MNIVDIILKKKNGEALSKEEIEYVINGFVNGDIEDYQISALLMAICIKGMTDTETFYLTEAMINSGEILDLSSIDGVKVDKHSTGGVGDKTTLIVLPLVAACGVNVAKMSGRGLGNTGGTIDKLESIKGFNVNLSNDEFINQVKNIGISLCSSNKNLAIADKKIYAIRDVTATVDSIPLIASSIMSKKLASGCNKIVIDVKVGNGAFMKTMEEATKLSKLLISIGNYFNREVMCVLSNMNEPLGNAVGNSLEVLEAIDTLKGNGPDDLTKLSLALASYMVFLSKNITIDEAMKMVSDKLIDGSAYKKFEEMVNVQQGDLNSIEISNNKIEVLSKETGFITSIDTNRIGELSKFLGAGREKVSDTIDHTVGMIIHKKVGDIVNVDMPLVTIYYNKEVYEIEKEVLKCFEFNTFKKDKEPLIYKIIK
ncbi:MAG: thymidine phosphorylase [Bacilli bacterium]|nr:thymidine phosphorylase [Bacilli bacterium]